MRGRRPKPPTEERKGHRAPPHPVVLGGRPELDEVRRPPPDLPAEARDLWGEIVVRLIDVGLVDRVDTASLEAMTTAYARFRQARRVIASDGLFVEGSRGQPRLHPAVRLEQESWAAFARWSEFFGLTPLSRVRLGLAELSRRSLAAEMHDQLGPLKLEPLPQPVDAQVVDDDDQAA